jgi:hypothetical protein
MEMKFVAAGICMLIIFSTIVGGCIYEEKSKGKKEEVTLDLLPEVRTSDNNYNESNPGNFWSPQIWTDFCDTYKDKYSGNLRSAVIADMERQAEELGEDPEILKDCIAAAGEEGIKLPCLAEKAKFNNSDVWIIVSAWGVDKGDLGHICFHIVDTSTFSVLHVESCD